MVRPKYTHSFYLGGAFDKSGLKWQHKAEEAQRLGRYGVVAKAFPAAHVANVVSRAALTCKDFTKQRGAR